ncbi:hypothetical protein EDC94DRAFT_629803 [Helicostylum pulchrum]|nr:hypothetical protein EDC94DRAFT_629803 [Helicostylum pulchrum]
MRLICVPNLTIFIFTVFTLSHKIFAQDVSSLNTLDPQQNIDDTSLFRGVENTMDEEGDDANRILKSLQDTSADDFSEDDDDQEVGQGDQVIHHSSSKDIKQRIQPDEGELEDDTDNDIDDDDDDIEEEEEEEDQDDDDQDEEEDYDFPADSFPDFRNEETAEFFDHLPQQISYAEKEKLAAAAEDDDDDDDDVDNTEEEEEEENIVDNMNNEKTTNTNNNNNDIPPIDTIPWHKSDPLEKAVIDDDKFYQEGNMNFGYEYKTSITEFKLWHGMCILLVLAIIYKWVNKTKSNHILDNNNTSWSNRDEKDYLPVSFLYTVNAASNCGFKESKVHAH